MNFTKRGIAMALIATVANIIPPIFLAAIGLVILCGIIVGYFLYRLFNRSPRQPSNDRVLHPTPHGRLRWLSKIKGAINFATQNVEHTAVIIAGPLLLLFALRSLLEFPKERDAWQKVLATSWDTVWLGAAICAFVLLCLAFMRSHQPLNEKFMRLCLRATIVVGLILMFLPWTVYLIQAIWPANLSTMPAQTPRSTGAKDEKVYVTLTGREEKGVMAISMSPQGAYRVCYVKGRITSYQPVTEKNYPYEIWGYREGYVVVDKWGKLDWHQNYRYSFLPDVLPNATLVVIGNIGSGQEKVIPFPAGNYCIDAKNESTNVQPLVLYYHAMQFYWEGNNGYIFPSQMIALSYGSLRPILHNGWQDQGKDGSTETFVITPLP